MVQSRRSRLRSGTAAGSLAFSRGQMLLHIVLPQCVRRMLPPWMNVYAIITMGTALSSLVGVSRSDRYRANRQQHGCAVELCGSHVSRHAGCFLRLLLPGFAVHALAGETVCRRVAIDDSSRSLPAQRPAAGADNIYETRHNHGCLRGKTKLAHAIDDPDTDCAR